MTKSLSKILNQDQWDAESLVFLLSLTHQDDMNALYKKAYQVKSETVGRRVYFRGLIEFSNICSKNCYYCGIRSSNTKTHRYEMGIDEIVQAALFAYKNSYGSIVLQSGERATPQFEAYVLRVLKEIKKITDEQLAITLSAGEQSPETYQKFFDAGAHRYLLRIETSNSELYKKLHPQDHSFEKRLQCLKDLKETGYIAGTGVMIGLPHQTLENLAEDLLFFKEMDIDMIGMGPFIEHPDTPLYESKHLLYPMDKRMELTLKMIAILRIMMSDVNIASTTALQAIDRLGREKGLLCGANVIMPNITPRQYRKDYLLYEGKPCLNEEASECKGCLENRILNIGEKIAFNEWGDPIHFANKNRKIN